MLVLKRRLLEIWKIIGRSYFLELDVFVFIKGRRVGVRGEGDIVYVREGRCVRELVVGELGR